MTRNVLLIIVVVVFPLVVVALVLVVLLLLLYRPPDDFFSSFSSCFPFLPILRMEAASAMVLILDTMPKSNPEILGQSQECRDLTLNIDQGYQGLSRTPPMTSIRSAVMEKWTASIPASTWTQHASILRWTQVQTFWT